MRRGGRAGRRAARCLLHERVPRVLGLLRPQVLGERRAAGARLVRRQRLHQRRLLDLKEGGDGAERARVVVAAQRHPVALGVGEVDVSDVQDRRHHLEHLLLHRPALEAAARLPPRDPERLHRRRKHAVLLRVGHAGDRRLPRARERRERVGRAARQVEPRLRRVGGAGEQLVETVVRALALRRPRDARLLEEVRRDVGADERVLSWWRWRWRWWRWCEVECVWCVCGGVCGGGGGVEVECVCVWSVVECVWWWWWWRWQAIDHLVGREQDLEELAEAARVVVAQRARVAERLEHRRRLQNLLGQSDDVDVVAAGAQPRAPRQVAEHVLRRFGLAGAGLAADDDRLVELVDDAQPVRAVGDRERVRRLGADRAAAVLFHRAIVVDAVDDAERVDGDEDRAGVRVHLLRLRLVPHARVVQQRRLREERQRRVVGARPIVGTRRAERGHRHGLLAARDLDAHHAVGRRRRDHLALDERRRRVADVARRRRAGQPHADRGER